MDKLSYQAIEAFKRSLVQSWIAPKANETTHICGCVGRQNGQPLCPCRMRNLQVVDGRYVEIIDHGPAPKL